MAKLNLSSPFLSAQASRVITPPVIARRSICCPASVLQPLPGLLLAEAIRPAVSAIATPVCVCLAWCPNQLLAAGYPFLLLEILWQVYPEGGAVRVGTRPLV